MINTISSVLLAALLSLGCQKADIRTEEQSSHFISSVSELKALSLEPGDVIVWKDGTYPSVKFTLNAKGTEEKPIVLRSETPGGVIFTGTSGITLSGEYLAAEGFCFNALDTSVKNSILTCAKGSSHCRFSQCRIDGTGSAESVVDTKWVNLYGSHNEISHCSFIDKRNMGCLLVVWLETGVVPSHTITGNSFTRPYTHYDEKGKARNVQETIRIGTSDYSMQDACCTVTDNYFFQCHGEMAEIISNKSCANVYEGNFFEDCKGSLTLRHGNRCVVRGNYFRSGGLSDVGGVRIIGEDHLVENNVMLNLTGNGYKSALCIVRGESAAALNGYWTVLNPVIRGNVFVDCKNSITVNYSGRSSQDSAPRNVLFDSNVVVSSKSNYVSVYVLDTPTSDLHWKDNLIWGGSQKGASVPQIQAKPTLEDYGEILQEIRSNAGILW